MWHANSISEAQIQNNDSLLTFSLKLFSCVFEHKRFYFTYRNRMLKNHMLKVSLEKRSKFLPKIKIILLETEAYLNTQVAIHWIYEFPIGKSN